VLGSRLGRVNAAPFRIVPGMVSASRRSLYSTVHFGLRMIMRVLRLARIMTLPLLLGGSGALSAQDLVGHVRDESGRPVADAAAALPALGRTITTSADGRFSFTRLPTGPQTLVVRRVGFAAILQRVEPGDTSVVVVLHPSSIVVDPIVVTAAAPGPASTTALPVAVLSGDQLRHDQSASLAHALARLPGVNAVTTGGQIGKPMLRGLYGPRVLVLDNGHRLEDYSWSDEDGPSADARLADRVEVVRGPASVLYGSEALGGIVNVVARELPSAADGARRLAGGVEAYGASNNIEAGASLGLQGAERGFGWRAAGVLRRGSNLHTPDGELDNTGFLSLSAELAAGSRSSRGGWDARLAHYGGEFKLLEAGGPPPGATDEGPERKAGDQRLQLGGYLLRGAWKLEASGQLQRHGLIEVSDDSAAGAPPGTEVTAFDLTLTTETFEARASRGIGARTLAVLSASGLLQQNDSKGPIALVPNASGRNGALAAFIQTSFGRWIARVGVRGDLLHLSTDSSAGLQRPADTRDDQAGSAHAGLVFQPGNTVTISGNIARAFRAPTLFERYTYGPHPGEARFEVGTPDLAPEAGTSADLTLRWQPGRVRAEVTAYRYDMQHFIYIAPTNVLQNGLPVYQYQQADALLTGAEGEVDVEVARGLVLSARGDAVRGTNTTANEPLPLIAPPRAALGVRHQSARHGQPGAWDAGVEVLHVWEQTRLNPLDSATSAHTTLAADAGVLVRISGRAMRLDLAARNLTNARYRDFLSRYKAFADEPGINIVFRLSTTL
jgi:iron complex outermembrane recepter protein